MRRQLSATDQRVHPYVDAPPLQYPSLQGSADNIDEHGLIKKEQERVLIEQPALISSERFHEEAPVGSTAQQSRRAQRRRRRCIRCCCCAGGCVGAIVVIIGILVMLFFLVLHPKLPKYTVTEASISKFSMTNTTGSGNSSSAAIASEVLEGDAEGVDLSVEMELTVRMRNPNTKIGIEYREIRGELLYAGVAIGEGSIPAFYQGHKNTTYVGLAMQGNSIAITPALAKTLASTLENETSLVLHARAITLVRIKIGHWKSHTSKVRVKCAIQLSNPSRGSVHLLHTSCKFKLLRLHL